MKKDRGIPSLEVEALIERTVRSHVRNARIDLETALAPMRERDCYRLSPILDALEAAYKAIRAAENKVEAWRLRAAPQGSLLEGLQEPPPECFDLEGQVPGRGPPPECFDLERPLHGEEAECREVAERQADFDRKTAVDEAAAAEVMRRVRVAVREAGGATTEGREI